MQIEIRPALINDLEAIICFDELGGDRSAEIQAGTCLAACCRAQIVGYASYEPRGLLGQPFLTFLCVVKPAMRQGVATALLQAVKAVASGRKLISSTENWCVDTQRIFEHLGWVRIGTITGVNKDGSAEWFYAVDLNR